MSDTNDDGFEKKLSLSKLEWRPSVGGGGGGHGYQKAGVRISEIHTLGALRTQVQVLDQRDIPKTTTNL